MVAREGTLFFSAIRRMNCEPWLATIKPYDDFGACRASKNERKNQAAGLTGAGGKGYNSG